MDGWSGLEGYNNVEVRWVGCVDGWSGLEGCNNVEVRWVRGCGWLEWFRVLQ